MPIDCPQRNERQPWLGDRTTGSTGESFLFANQNLYAKCLDDIEDAQTAEGAIPDVAPAFWNYYSDNVTWPGRIQLFCETSGVGDFVGSHPGNLMKPPTPMSSVEILRMLGPQKKVGDTDAAPTIAPAPNWLKPGDRVRVVDGTFNGMDGNIKQILEAVSKVQVELAIFGRPVNVDFEYYQVEQI